MARQSDERNRWQILTEQIAETEGDLRPHFDATPAPSPECLARVKAVARSEAIRVRSARGSHRLLRVATAAAILLAVGLGLYFGSAPSARQDHSPAAPGIGMRASVDPDGLDAFTASLARVLSDENPAVGELANDLQDLESEYRSNG